ncbi:hypothetical protein LTR37_013654 [Vermiconidia calcicola]|uniref:Uncharacterized protein n=1 Tax=Vermiconidia calcicola TaxID=1690605 RepID=A0ACC3MVY6_9PEZI|nr:hypothetical protein LTR37_013654 [Vermiconidia calcicola]
MGRHQQEETVKESTKRGHQQHGMSPADNTLYDGQGTEDDVNFDDFLHIDMLEPDSEVLDDLALAPGTSVQVPTAPSELPELSAPSVPSRSAPGRSLFPWLELNGFGQPLESSSIVRENPAAPIHRSNRLIDPNAGPSEETSPTAHLHYEGHNVGTGSNHIASDPSVSEDTSYFEGRSVDSINSELNADPGTPPTSPRTAPHSTRSGTSNGPLQIPPWQQEPIQIGEPANAWACSICDKRFDISSACKKHQMYHMHYAERRHVCSICQKRFVLRKDLRRHLRTVHSDELFFFCSQCGEGFKRADHLDRHAPAECQRDTPRTPRSIRTSEHESVMD